MQIAIIEAVGIVKQCRAVLSFETRTILIDTNKQCPNFVLAKVVSIGSLSNLILTHIETI